MQILYKTTGRFALVSCALVAFLTLSWGLWLFTLVTPAFYWFGIPATFMVFYTAAHCALHERRDVLLRASCGGVFGVDGMYTCRVHGLVCVVYVLSI